MELDPVRILGGRKDEHEDGNRDVDQMCGESY